MSPLLQMSWQTLRRTALAESSVRIRGAEITTECAGEELLWPGYIRVGWVELVMGSSPLFG